MVETMTSHYPNPGERSSAIRDMYVQETGRAAAAEKGIHAPLPEEREGAKLPTPFEHVQMCREFLQEEDEMPDIDDIFTLKLLEQKLNEIREDSRLKLTYPPGREIMLAVIPFTSQGSVLMHEEIEDGRHVKRLQKDENGNIIEGFSMFNNKVNRLIPREFLECSFVVPPYDNDKIDQPSPDDYLRIEQLYTQAFNKLKEKFKMAIAN